MNRLARFEELQSQCLPQIERRLEKFFSSSKRDGIHWNSEMSVYHFCTGGKRLRALLPCWVLQASGQDALNGVTLGCAIELIHNATLVHDDFQDGDTLRRGQPTVWQKFGVAQSINCGDAMFQFAFQLLDELQVDAEIYRRISRRLTRATLAVIEGQAQEFLMKDEPYPTLERYLGVVRGKTAALIAASISSALEQAGLPENLCDDVEKVAMHSGILFQIQDDLLDLYGEKARDRKATDIAEGKISALIAIFNDSADEISKRRVAGILRTPRETTSDSQIREVLSLFEHHQVKEQALSRIEAIQDSLRNHTELSKNFPQIQQLLLQMNQIFLAPIRHLISEPQAIG